MTDLSSQTDSLYELPLASFIEVRNSLAAELKRAGKSELSREVKGLRKPSLAAWALNQVARRHPDKLHELVEIGAGLVRASEEGESVALREFTGRRHALVRELTKLAATALVEDGHAESAGVLTRVSQSLYASATDMEGLAVLQRGCLTEDLSATGFDQMFAAAVPGDAAGTGIAAEQGESQPDTRRQHEVLKEEARAAGERLQRLQRDVERAEADAVRTRRDAERAEANATRARREAEQAEDAAEAARRAARDAEQATEQARRAADGAGG